MAILYIVATPIGNLKDISLRALETLKEVDLILSEDTRVTKKLLDHYQIKTPTLSYHQYSKIQKIDYIIDFLKKGKNLALVSDAGTPGISDPGNKLVQEVIKSLTELPKEAKVEKRTKFSSTSDQVEIVPIPGPSAVIAAASASGFSMDRFLFLGFPPTKKKRKKFFEEIMASKHPVIFYESPYRIIKTLKELQLTISPEQIPSELYEVNNKQLTIKIVVCRELTKKFETIYRGTIEEVIRKIEKDKIKGEFVVVIEGKK